MRRAVLAALLALAACAETHGAVTLGAGDALRREPRPVCDLSYDVRNDGTIDDPAALDVCTQEQLAREAAE